MESPFRKLAESRRIQKLLLFEHKCIYLLQSSTSKIHSHSFSTHIGKYICQDTFAKKAYSSHVYKQIQNLCTYMYKKEALQFASKNEEAVFQTDNVIQSYQEGQESQ